RDIRAVRAPFHLWRYAALGIPVPARGVEMTQGRRTSMKRIMWAGLVTLALLAGCTQEATTKDSNRVAISVTEEGCVPASAPVAAGRPVTLVVTRKTTKTCANELVMPA